MGFTLLLIWKLIHKIINQLAKVLPFCLCPDLFIFLNYLFYFWLHWVLIAACRLSLVVASRSYSLVVVHKFLLAVAPLIADYEL